MILLSTTMNIEVPLHDEWFQWIKTSYLPAMMDTGLFVGKKVLRLLNEEQYNPGITYSFQFSLKSIKDLELYSLQFEASIDSMLFHKYKDKCMVFKTVLKEVELD